MTTPFCKHQRDDAHVLDVFTSQFMCPLCIALNGIDSREPRYIYVINPMIPRLCRMRLDPLGSMNRAADYVLRDEFRLMGYTGATRLMPPVFQPLRERAPATDDEIAIFDTFTRIAGTGVHTLETMRSFATTLDNHETANMLSVIVRLIARHASLGLLFETPRVIFDGLHRLMPLLTGPLNYTPEMLRLKRNMVRAMAGVSRSIFTQFDLNAVKPALQHIFLAAGFEMAQIPIHTDGGRSIAAVADLLLALFRFHNFNWEETVRMFSNVPAILEALRELAAGPPDAAPRTVAIAAKALRVSEQKLAEARGD